MNMSLQRKELAGFVAKVKAYVDKRRVDAPHARVLTSRPLESSAATKEQAMLKSLSQVPQMPAATAAAPPRSAKVVFVSANLMPADGAAGRLLAKIVQAMGLQPWDAAYCDVAGLQALVQEAKPKALVALGEAAAKALLGTGSTWDKMRGRFAQCQGLPLMATHHPEELLEQEALKRHVWEDMKQVAAKIKD
jgi:hypothetical protein